MKEYYVHNGYKLDGPYTTEQVKQLPLTAYHSIWYRSSLGLTTVDDLKELHALKNTPISVQETYTEIFPISGINIKRTESSKVMSALKKAYAAFFY